MEKWKDHAIAYAIMNSMVNLHFDKEGYFIYKITFWKRELCLAKNITV